MRETWGRITALLPQDDWKTRRCRSWFKLRPIYATWITGNWLLLVSVTFIESMPRYALTIFLIFFFFAFVVENRFWRIVITMWPVLFLALFSSLFVRGWCVF